MLGAFAVTGLLAGLLFGVGTRDPAAFVAAPLIPVLAAAAASAVPARRAGQVDPAAALRAEEVSGFIHTVSDREHLGCAGACKSFIRQGDYGSQRALEKTAFRNALPVV